MKRITSKLLVIIFIISPVVACSAIELKKMNEKFNKWTSTEFKVSNDTQLNFEDFLEYLYSKPPYVVGRKIEKLDIPMGLKMPLKKGRYTRKQLINLAVKAYRIDIKMNTEDQILIFTAKRN